MGKTVKANRAGYYNSRQRSSGQALVEGTVALVMIAGIVIGGTLLVIGCGLGVYYKTKLAFAAETGARYGGQGAYWLGAKRKGYDDKQLTTDVTNSVNATLIGLGLPMAKDGKITAKSVTVNGIEGMQVTVEEGGLQIISGGLLPPSITLSETAFYPYGNDKPTALLGLSVGGTTAYPDGQGLFLPMYGGGALGQFNTKGTATQGPRPSGSLPYWKVAVIGEVVNGLPVSRVEGYGELDPPKK